MADRLTITAEGSYVILPPMLAASDVARYLGLTTAAVRLWIADGTLAALRIGRQWRIGAPALLALIAGAIARRGADTPRPPSYDAEAVAGGYRVPALLSVRQLAEHLRVTSATVRRHIGDGSIPAIRLFGCYYIVPADARRALQPRRGILAGRGRRR